MLRTLDGAWREAFTLAWKSYCSGSLPIGCVIWNEEGKTVSQGRNRLSEKGDIPNHKIKHAEMEALRLLDSETEDPKKCTLFSTVEPCPMCFGAAVMANIRRIQIAARDEWAGACRVEEQSRYVRSKKMDIRVMEGYLAALSVALCTAKELEQSPEKSVLLDALNRSSPEGCSLGRELYHNGTLRRLREENANFSDMYAAVEGDLGGAIPALRAAEPMQSLGQTVSYRIDRPIHTAHPQHANIFYRLNYGYVPGVTGGDGAEQDVYVMGLEEPVNAGEGVVIGLLRRLDDVEDKWVVAPKGMHFTREEILRQTFFQEQFFQSVLFT